MADQSEKISSRGFMTLKDLVTFVKSPPQCPHAIALWEKSWKSKQHLQSKSGHWTALKGCIWVLKSTLQIKFNSRGSAVLNKVLHLLNNRNKNKKWGLLWCCFVKGLGRCPAGLSTEGFDGFCFLLVIRFFSQYI